MHALRQALRSLEARFKILTFVGALLPTVAALGVQLAAFAITARGLGVDAFGVYTALLAISVIGVEMVGFGGADLLVRAVSRDGSVFGVYFGNMIVMIVLTLPLVALVGLWVAFHFMRTPLDAMHVLAVVVGEVIVGRAASSLELIMVAHRHTVRAGWVRLTTAGVRLVAAVVFFLLAGASDLESWVVVAFSQSVATTVLYVWLAAFLYGRPSLRVKWDELNAGGAFCVNQAARASQGNIDRVVLSRFADATSVGIYGAATRVLAIGLFPLQVVTRITYPNFFIHGQKGIVGSRRYALKIAPILFGVGLASSAAVAVGGYLAPAVLGEDFSRMSGVSAVLGLALPLIALQYAAADALTGAGRQGLRAVLSLVATFGFGLVTALGAKLAGTEGLVFAFLASHALFAVALWMTAFLVKREAIESAAERGAERTV